MDLTTAAIIIGVAAILAALVWLAVTVRQQQAADQSHKIETVLQTLKSELLEKQMDGLVSLRESLDSANRLMNERLAEGNTALDRRMDLFAEVENKLGQLQTQTKNIETIGQNIQSLTELLRPPQLRGALGEILLENLLAQILPKSLYSTQYRLADGQRVDAVVKLADRLLPIDSKFPLETFQRLLADTDSAVRLKELTKTLNRHVDSISSKYLRPDQGTTDIALMYIPSEAIYYRFVAQSDCEGLQYALSRKVIPSSPGHLYAFLASLSAVYTQAGLTGESRRLVATLDALAGSLSHLDALHERMEGSVRRLSLSVTKAKDETDGMSRRLEELREPTPAPAEIEREKLPD